MSSLAHLEPALVWRHFQTLLNTPRASKREARIRDHLRQWAEQSGWIAEVDLAGNLLIRKPATPGRENCPIVVIQAHLDMVCQKNAGTTHDFEHDPIHTELRDGWLTAPETTLGADNGIGVALALALLEAEDAVHPPLEVLLTVDEEAGMGGANGLAADWLKGSLMINLDTEDWGEFYLGCAGGADVNVHLDLATEPVPADHASLLLEIAGLRGGHSGVDIHLERGNAIKLLVRLLHRLQSRFGGDFRCAGLDGGTARNALAREATAAITIAAGHMEALKQMAADYQALLHEELAGADNPARVRVLAAPAPHGSVLTLADQARFLAAFNAAPHGVWRMSQKIASVVDTSNNLGILKLVEGCCDANLMVRSLTDTGTSTLAAEIASLFTLAGATVEVEGQYPGWQPNPDSRLLALCQMVYQREFNTGPALVKVIHAGLECGIIGARYPALDTISFGPDIRGAHAPGERVEIESVGHCWKLLKALVAAIPEHAGA